MNTYSAFDLINEWSKEANPPDDFQKIAEYITFFAPIVNREYEPTQGPFPPFVERLSSWVGNVHTSHDQQTLIRLIPRIFFAGVKEFESLYRVALNSQIARWLIDLLGLMLDASTTGMAIQKALKRTWICPVSDSLRINAFYKANNISGREHRPDWKSLSNFADAARITEFMGKQGIEQVVLLEDFVGTGQQIAPTLDYAISICGNKPILFVPLLICQEGLKVCQALEKKHSTFRVAPVVVIPDRYFIKKVAIGEELHDAILSLAEKYNSVVRKRNSGPLGYGSVGGLIVLHTNCPNNSLPVLHRSKAQWQPLFPRIART